jgi:signal transduction histidine kinase
VDLSLAGDVLTVRVTDDGVGVGHTSRSSGTANLAARAHKWGGSFEVAAGPMGGTVATWAVRVP